MPGLAFLFGTVVVLVGVLVAVVVSGFKPWTIVEGADGRPSTSKFQWTLWTSVILFSYSAIYFARAAMGSWEALPNIPANILIVLGFSTTTMVVAKGITTQFVASGRVVKPSGGQGGLLSDDVGQTDLSKVQLVMWTFLAVGIYLATVVMQVSALAHGSTVQGSNRGLPDIDGSLMVLMGFAQGGYLGKKLVTTTQPAPTSLAPPRAAPGQTIAVIGTGFGDLQGTSLLTLNANPVPVTTWSDTKIVFTLPSSLPDGTNVSVGTRVQVGLIVNGQAAGQILQLPISTPASVLAVAPPEVGGQSTVSVSGSGFGNEQADSMVTFDGIPVPVQTWTDTEIVVFVPPQLADGTPTSGRTFQVGVQIHGQPGSATQPLTVT